MAITNFIPEIWSARISQVLEAANVSKQVTNADYQGEISRMGDTVNVTGVVSPTVGSYTAHTDITVEDIDDDSKVLLINIANYFAFEMDDIEAAQSVNGGSIMEQALLQAGAKLATALDVAVFDEMGANAGIDGGDVAVSSAALAYTSLVDISVALDEGNVPEFGRFAVVTPAFYGYLLQDPRFVSSGDQAGAATRATGLVGSAAGLSLYKSNNLADGAVSGKLLVAGTSAATTVAQQINKVVPFESELRFNEGVKGLHLFGTKVIDGASLLQADVTIS
jgi:hypothetical protein